MGPLRSRLAVLAGIIALSIAASLWHGGRMSRQAGEGLTSQIQPPPKKRVFKGPAGQTIEIETPLIDSFAYIGDGPACDAVVRFLKENGEPGWENDSFCRNMPAKGDPARDELLESLTMLATDREEAQNEISPSQLGERVRFTFGVMHERLDGLDETEAQRAFNILLEAKAANDAPDGFYPGETKETFPLKAPIEAGEARLALCPIVRPTLSMGDCFEETTFFFLRALRQYGRLKSDKDILLRAADLTEQRYQRITSPDLEQETDFVVGLASALGYAGELEPEDANATRIFQRAIRQAEAWLKKYEKTARTEDVTSIYDSLTGNYGRLTTRSHKRADAIQAIAYAEITQARSLDRGEGEKHAWAATANLGDAYLDLAEIDHTPETFEKALATHRSVLNVVSREEGRWPIDAVDVNYCRLKLARTLLHYEQADLEGMTPEARRTMLSEARGLASTARDYFIQAGTRHYISLLDSILTGIDRRRALLTSSPASKENIPG